RSVYEAKKIVKDLGLHYVKIDACINNCILYRKEYSDLDKCPKCGEKRWQYKNKDDKDEYTPNSSGEKDKVSTLVLEKLQDVEEDVDQTTIVNEAFVSIVGQKSEYCRGRGKGPKPMNKYGACIQEQLATQQREANEARRRTSELLTTLGVQAQLMEERENREEMEARFNERQKKMQETMGNQVQEAI
ncbi:hypothetical protein PIB30_047170, partial [Stylosanthes scabra]|nr:hypothetical protein [Stylosanthes scabra]